MNPSDIPDGFVRVVIEVEGTAVARATLRDVASASLRAQLHDDCWVVEPDDADGVTVRHNPSECTHECRDHQGVLVDGSQHYGVDELLRLLLLAHLGVPLITQHAGRPDDGLRA